MKQKDSSAFLLNLEKDKLNEINAYTGGRDIHVAGGYVYGPFMCDCYVVEYCKSGGMTLLVDGVARDIGAGDMYLVSPCKSMEKRFTAESTSTVWAAIGGVKLAKYLKAVGFSNRNIVFPSKLTSKCADLLEELVDSFKTHEELSVENREGEFRSRLMVNEGFSDQLGLEADLRESAAVCLFLAELVKLYGTTVKTDQKTPGKAQYVSQAIRYIDANYSFDISVDGIAKHLGITRNYLFSVFSEQMGMSVQKYLMQVRMNAACEFLRQPNALVKTAAASVGYDPLAFSRAFKNFFGISPAEYQRRQKAGKN